MTDDFDYEKRLRALKRQFWYGLAIVLIGIASAFAGIKYMSVICVFAFVLLIGYSLYKTITFRKYFNSYWRSEGLDDQAIRAKWHEIFPLSLDA